MQQLHYREHLNQKFRACPYLSFIYQGFILEENIITIKFLSRKLVFSFYKDDIVNIFIGDNNEKPRETGAVIYEEKEDNIKVEEKNTYLKIILNNGYIIVDKNTTKISFLDKQNNIICRDFQPSFVDKDGFVYISKENDALAYYGFGERGGELNKKGSYIENYNTDDPETDDNSTVYYKTIPFYIGLKENSTYGLFFDNSFRSFFDMGKSYGDRVFFGANGGSINYYFIFGNDIKNIVEKYTKLTGRMEMPPMWSLGYQQCRFSYFSRQEVEELISTFEEKKIPIDVVYLDIDYMDSFRVMTFKSPEFDNIADSIVKFKEKGIKTITILDPGVKVDEEYELYKNGMELDCYTKTLDGKVYVGAVWPGDSVFPDFSNEKCRKWWKEELKKFIDKNHIDGIWNDMNEPCVFNNDFKTLPETCLHNSDYGVIEHKEFHNRYGFEMSRSSYEAQKELYPDKRGFSMTRATYSGGQRYSSIWTGDNMSLFTQLRMSISMNASLGMSGFSFVGNDVAGFGLDANEELFIRWNQVGTFLPIFRNHSNMYTRRQEPWAFGKRAEYIAKKCIELRYELMPYIYNMYYYSFKLGYPVFRPMIMEFQKDINCINLKEQFMFGNNILVAPVLYEGEREKLVYLPKGIWYNYFTNEKYEGGRYYNLRCELDEILVFVRDGAIIPIFEEKYLNMKNRPKIIKFKCYGEKAKYTYYCDDGESNAYLSGEYNIYEVSFSNNIFNMETKYKGKLEEEKFLYLSIK